MTENWIKTMSRSVTARPALFLIISLTIMVVSLVPVKNLTFNSNYSIWFLKNDPAIKEFEKFKKDYDWAPHLLIGYESMGERDNEEFAEWLKKQKFSKKVSQIPGKPVIRVAIIYPDEDPAISNKKIVRTVKEHLTKFKGAEFHLGGIASSHAFYQNSKNDQYKLAPVFALIVLVFLIFFFRTAAGYIIPQIVIILTASVTFGILGWMNWPLNILNSVLVLIVVAVSISDCVHYLTEFYHFRKKGMNPIEAAEAGFCSLFKPCFYTTLTTSAGFISLTLSDLRPVREFGFAAAIGVWFAFYFTFFTVPIFLRKSSSLPPERKLNPASLIRLSKKYKWVFIITALSLIIVSLFNIKNIKTESTYRNYFKKNAPAGKDIDWLIEKTGIARQLNIVVPLPDKTVDADDLSMCKNIKSELLSIQSISSVVSPSDLPIPALIKGSGLQAVDDSSLMLLVFISNTEDSIFQQTLELIKKKMDAACKEEYVLTGQSVLASNMNTSINKGVGKSFMAAALIIAACLMLSLRNVKLSALAFCLSLWPLLLTAGIMPLAGISLNLTTMMIAAITFSTVVDDNIHIMSKYNEGLKSGLGISKALEFTMQRSGMAVLISSVILGLGFTINIFGSHNPTHQFGILASMIVILALIADTVLFIALVSLKAGKPRDNS